MCCIFINVYGWPESEKYFTVGRKIMYIMHYQDSYIPLSYPVTYILTGADDTELALDSRVLRVGMVRTQHEMPTVASGNSSSSVHSLRSGLYT